MAAAKWSEAKRVSAEVQTISDLHRHPIDAAEPPVAPPPPTVGEAEIAAAPSQLKHQHRETQIRLDERRKELFVNHDDVVLSTLAKAFEERGSQAGEVAVGRP